jgi:hypothetical protein
VLQTFNNLLPPLNSLQIIVVYELLIGNSLHHADQDVAEQTEHTMRGRKLATKPNIDVR